MNFVEIDLAKQYPSPDDLLKISTEELGQVIWQKLKEFDDAQPKNRPGKQSLSFCLLGWSGPLPQWEFEKKEKIDKAIEKAWDWLYHNKYLITNFARRYSAPVELSASAPLTHSATSENSKA